MTARIVSALEPFTRRLLTRQALQGFAILTTVLGFWEAFHLHEYAPMRRRIADGIFWTSVANTGLWLSTFRIQGPARFVVAILLLPSTLGNTFVLGNLHFILGYAALALHIALIASVVRKGTWHVRSTQ